MPRSHLIIGEVLHKFFACLRMQCTGPKRTRARSCAVGLILHRRYNSFCHIDLPTFRVSCHVNSVRRAFLTSKMPRKGTKVSSGFAKRKRRRFSANQHTIENDTSYASTSAEKLRDTDDDISVDPSSSYVLLNFLLVFNFLSLHLKCKSCDGDVSFSQSATRGLGFKLEIICKCPRYSRSVASCPLINSAYEVNRRLMFVMRLLGLGQRGVNVFCGLMDLSTGFGNSTYYAFLENLYSASKTVFDYVCSKAVREEIAKNREHGNEPTHLSVSGDGSWKKRGFSSLYGICSLIGKYSKKVVDVVVKSAFCQGCSLRKGAVGSPEYEEWLETHQETCSINHQGSSGKMEVDAVLEMFGRSEELHGVKYRYYIGDGDTKTFKSLLDMDPYPDLTVEKRECVGHVQKRMGTRLRAAKKQNKGVGGKGQGKLTDGLIKQLTIYYGLAIRRHPNSAGDMKKAVWATFLHKCSTDQNPQHDNCPAGSGSWCQWQVAKANGELEKFKHAPPLADKVQEILLPIYESLSNDDLLNRCLGGNTQNNNESLNACVWKLTPKHINCGAKTVAVATFLASSVFNEGYTAVLKTMTTLGIRVGLQCRAFAAQTDAEREKRAERRLSPAAIEALQRHRSDRLLQDAFYEEEEGLMYGPGIAD